MQTTGSFAPAWSYPDLPMVNRHAHTIHPLCGWTYHIIFESQDVTYQSHKHPGNTYKNVYQLLRDPFSPYWSRRQYIWPVFPPTKVPHRSMPVFSCSSSFLDKKTFTGKNPASLYHILLFCKLTYALCNSIWHLFPQVIIHETLLNPLLIVPKNRTIL